jgi:lipopolysaccharide transport system permease protein
MAEIASVTGSSIPVEPFLKIRPPTGWSALNLGDVWRFRDLMMALAGRDVKLRYKQTALGIIWVVLQPLMSAGVFSFVFGHLANMDTDGVPYFLYSYVGLLGWGLFLNTITKTSGCLVGNSQLISKIFFPRLVLPFSAVPSVLIDFGIAFLMLVVLMPLSHRHPPVAILLLPFSMLLLLMLSMGVGLIAAALTVSYRDVQYIIPVMTNILFFGTPIAYTVADALKKIPAKYQWIYLMNPLVAPLQAFKASLLNTSWPSPLSLLYATVFSVGMIIVGAYSFKKMERKFADII